MRDPVEAGLAHEFRNALAALLGRTEVMLARLDAGTLDAARLRQGLESILAIARDAIGELEREGARPRDREAARPAVLVVEDDRVFGALLEELLGSEGWQVQLAADAPAALEALARQTFQVVVTDLVLPEADGWMVARAARQHDPRCRIVVMSGAMGPEDVDAGAPAVDAFLTKPIDLDRLLAVLAALSPRPGRG